MYLKEIEVQGFKSFADKLNIGLDKDITCIVGPNGSGKSNVVDAVRWVLGEQSVKNLRGDSSMTDVIFLGSKNRNPLNFCSVTLVFDNNDKTLNTDFNDVSVKRKLYRTGESEYYLNGTKVRRTDVIELFLDTGIGKSSYNIIGQGEISKILSNSPQERRQVIESSAGILKYKERRENALKKLDKANLNLDRINDIVGEIEGRVKPLERQSKKAQDYLTKKDELKNIEVSLLAKEIESNNQELEETKQKIEELNKKTLSLSTLLTNTKVEELKVEKLNLENNLNGLNKQILEKTQEEEKLNGQKNIINERGKYQAESIKVHENIQNLKETKLKLQNEIELKIKDKDFKEKNLEETTNSIQELVNVLQSTRQKKDNLYREYTSKDREYLDNNTKISVLRESIETGSNLSPVTRRILGNPRLSGIHSAFANLIEVNPKYEKALEANIQGIKNDIVVDNEVSAKMAIDFLNQNKLGRATFLPLNVIKPRVVDYETLDVLEREIDYLGRLSEFTEYKDTYRNIVENLLGNIIVVTDLDAGNKIGRLIKNRYKIVTLNGELINPGGSITGGSLNQNSQIKAKNELNDLLLRNNSIEITLNSLKEELDQIGTSIINIENKIYEERSNNTKLSNEIDLLNNSILENNRSLENIDLELSNLETNNISEELDRITEEYYETKKQKDMLLKDKEELDKQLSSLTSIIEEQEAEDRLNNNNLRELEKEINSLEIEKTKLDSRIDNDLLTLNQDYELTFERARDNFMLTIDMEEAREKVDSLKQAIRDIGSVNLEAIEEYKQVKERYDYLSSQKEDCLKAKETLYSIIDEMDDIMKQEFLSTFNQLEVEFSTVFKQLFKGGNAKLSLTDPNNLLETGIEIEACPPGKTLKSINSLSGGEKTLTAIALLFAMLNVRSVPFCILDEVEAALDEPNVDTFGHYLDNYKDKTQFLLITHKKRTMEYCKTLYGITMQEQGVSKLVSVKFENS